MSILSSTRTGKKAFYKYFPKNKSELIEIIKAEIKENGNECSLNHIDTSEITDMSYLFSGALSQFNGDISKWDTSNVKYMSYMFAYSHFNRDISKWDVSNVRQTGGMFAYSHFNGDISKWDISNVTDIAYMFSYSHFNGDISNWNISNIKDLNKMFFKKIYV